MGNEEGGVPPVEPVVEESAAPAVDEKLQAINAQIEAMNQATTAQLNQMTAAIQQQAAASAPVSTSTEEEDFYNLNPAEYKAKILAEARAEASAASAASMERQNKLQSTIVRLQGEFPEISDASGTAYKKVLEIHSKLSPTLQETPEGYELAVRQATSSLGLLPKSLRTSSENVNIKGGSSSGSSKSTSSSKGLADETIAMAQLMGLNVNDPKVVERLQAHSKRDFRRYK